MNSTETLSVVRHVHALLVASKDVRGFEHLMVRISDAADADGHVTLDSITREELDQRLTSAEAASDKPPDLVLIFQSWSEEFTEHEVAGLLSRWPLTRWVCGYGPWCESDGRTRVTWPRGTRTPATLLPKRFVQELQVARGEAQFLPVTASREEAFAADYLTDGFEGDECRPPLDVAVEIVTADRIYGEGLVLLARRAGWDARWIGAEPQSSDTSSDKVRPQHTIRVWDAVPLEDRNVDDLSDCAAAVSERAQTVVALVGFPGSDLVDNLEAVGVAAMIPKLAPASVLLKRLRDVATDIEVRSAE